MDLPSGPANKRLKTDGTQRGNKVENKGPNPEYKMLDGENFTKVFCGKNVCHRVNWDKKKGTRMCPRWHSRYYCFDNCHTDASHIPQDEVSPQMDIEYKKFLKKIRKN